MSDTRFAVAAGGSIQLMGHVIADYPSPQAARDMIRTMITAGAAVVEIQIPYSEPMADGPVFMEANQQALAQGVRVSDAFALMRDVTQQFPKNKFLFMTYANIIVRLGAKKFVEKAVQVGAAGIIVPDLAYDTHRELYDLCVQHGLAWIPVVSPNITDKRLKMLCNLAMGFVYLSARLGVTGAQTTIDPATINFCNRVKSFCELPIALGFGIKNSAQISDLIGAADFAVIGSQNLITYRATQLQGLQQLWQSFANASIANRS